MKRTLALAALAALAGCNSAAGGGGSFAPNPFPTAKSAPATSGNAILSAIVGVGDSLTAGMESEALVGQTAANPLYPAQSALPVIPDSQDYGFFADLWSAAKGGASASGVLPLIKTPGIGTFLIPTTTGGFTSTQTNCSGLNASAFDPVQALTTRISPTVPPYDLGIPGQMVHEALYQTAPYGSCAVLSVAPGALFQGESQAIYPVLGNFPGLSQVRAAASLKPTLATVWLGANDLLKYAESGGAFGPTPVASIQSDIQTAVQTLQNAGAQVALANLPDVLDAPLFIPIAGLPLYLEALGIPAAAAQQIAAGVEAANGLGAGSYVTLAAIPAIAAVAQGAPIPTLGAGQALSASLAASVQQTNNAYNAAIASVAAATGAALVDIHSAFAQIFTQGAPVNPPKCCNAQFGGGIFSYDGIHPSYTGYALVANVFASAINAKFGTTIPQVNVSALYAVDPYAPH